MNPKLKEIVDYLAVAHPQGHNDLDKVIRDCALHGFAIFQIISGLESQYGLSHREAKEMVAGHPVWGNARTEWAEFHVNLQKALEDDQSKP